jgi:hypothetical protein
MATLTLHDVPEDVLTGLEQVAPANGRSLNSQGLEVGLLLLLAVDLPRHGRGQRS